MEQNLDHILMPLVFIVIFLVLVLFALKLIPLLKEIRHVKIEIARSTGSEQRYWQRKLKKLYKDFFTKL
jgi:hypothetical protein